MNPSTQLKQATILWIVFMSAQGLFAYILYVLTEHQAPGTLNTLISHPAGIPLVMMTPSGWILGVFLPSRLFPVPRSTQVTQTQDSQWLTRYILRYVFFESSTLIAMALGILTGYKELPFAIMSISLALIASYRPKA